MIPLATPDLFQGLIVFLSLFCLQALLWHFFNIPRQMWVLFGLYLVGPTVAYIFGFLGFAGYFFALLLSSNYISVFPVLQATSPTILILEKLYRRKRMNEQEIFTEVLRLGLVSERLQDLESGSLVTRLGSEYKLTTKGNILASCFIGFRKFLGLPQGAG